MSDDAIQDLIAAYGACPWCAAALAARAQAQHTANRNTIASLRSSLEGRAAEVAQLQARLAEYESHPLLVRCVGCGAGTCESCAALQAKVARLESAIAEAACVVTGNQVLDDAINTQRIIDAAREALDVSHLATRVMQAERDEARAKLEAARPTLCTCDPCQSKRAKGTGS